MTEPRTWDNIGQQYTSDGTLIVPGLRIRNYNFDEDVVVNPVPWGNVEEAVWFYTNRGVFDGSRMIALQQ